MSKPMDLMAATLPASVAEPLVTCATQSYVEMYGTFYSSTGLLHAMAKDPTRFAVGNLIGDLAAGAAAGTGFGATLGAVLAIPTLGLSVIASIITAGMLSKQHFALVVVINKCPEDLVLSAKGTGSDGNPYCAHGYMRGRPLFSYTDPTSGATISGRANVVPAARTDAAGNNHVGMAMWLYENNDFLGMATRGAEGVMVLEGAQGKLGPLALSWSSPFSGPVHAACELDYTNHYPDPSTYYAKTTEKEKTKGTASTVTCESSDSNHKVSMSIMDRDYAHPIYVPCSSYDDLVYTVCVEPV